MPQYSDIPVTPVYGPLSHQYPGIQPRLNLAVCTDSGHPYSTISFTRTN